MIVKRSPAYCFRWSGVRTVFWTCRSAGHWRTTQSWRRTRFRLEQRTTRPVQNAVGSGSSSRSISWAGVRGAASQWPTKLYDNSDRVVRATVTSVDPTAMRSTGHPKIICGRDAVRSTFQTTANITIISMKAARKPNCVSPNVGTRQ